MTEEGAIRAIESIAESYYHNTKDKWWLKLAIYYQNILIIKYRHWEMSVPINMAIGDC